MSVNKLLNFLQKEPYVCGEEKLFSPIVVSDSKGNWLKRKVESKADQQIGWWAKSGCKTKEEVQWLESKLKYVSNNLWLYIWTGTCDLTTKSGKYISLTSQEGDETVNSTVEHYRKIIEIGKKYPNIKITILETPVYSVKEFNQQKGHKNPEIFDEQDKELERQIYLLNQKVRELNEEEHHHSPTFSIDLRQISVVKKGKARKPTKVRKHNFKLYADGIHPDTILAKVWLRKIANQIATDCYKKK